MQPRRPWQGRRVVLGVTGGIAAYKSIQLARDLTLLGSQVDVVMTEAARRFVGPLSFEGVTGRRVARSLWSADGSALHLSLGRDAHLFVVAPATADFLARAAHGRADDLLTTVLLATRAPVLLAPAMNHRMWDHPQTGANVQHCRDRLGYHILGPHEGRLGAGEGSGMGRMVEPSHIVEWCGRLLSGRTGSLSGRSVLVTAGPTREPLDPVRFLGNRSSGRMGFSVAREAWLRGADVTLVSGPSSLPDPVGIRVIRVETARDMLGAVEAHVASAQIVVYAAAVADYRPMKPASRKTRKSHTGDRLTVELGVNPDIAAETASLTPAGGIRVGFALETDDLLERAGEKLRAKGFDLIVANPAGEDDAGFDVDTNRVTILDRHGGTQDLPLLLKDEVAGRILDRVESLLEGGMASGAAL
ncbi:MAG: bifunctional phosphopantothenoylcysteine decarboxylase/phosphopantothenate--cysteine ligase CoaBC [Gemmatimonadales bacterium]|nr:MAG: bifunctional phosphopantothenoylcysteine decarboxylase/phosphopantothenate--cysteine ligase CoaBC [Gemmatimonadales bacterium]